MADFEDSQDKARRNLLMMSAAILASAYLQPKFADKGKIFGFIDADGVNPWRMWAVITMVLLYLGLRYWFSESRDLARLDLETDHRRRLRERIEQRIRVLIGRDGGKSSDQSLDTLHEFLVEIPGGWPVQWEGEARLTWRPVNGSSKDETVGPYSYQLVGWARWRLTILTWARTITFSRGAYELALPLTLAALALVLCGYSLVRHWGA